MRTYPNSSLHYATPQILPITSAVNQLVEVMPQRMLAEDLDATHTAYQVGYESASQFSPEYARMFGAPPMKDIERLRTA